MQTSEEMHYFNKDAQTSTLGRPSWITGRYSISCKKLMS